MEPSYTITRNKQEYNLTNKRHTETDKQQTNKQKTINQFMQAAENGTTIKSQQSSTQTKTETQ